MSEDLNLDKLIMELIEGITGRKLYKGSILEDMPMFIKIFEEGPKNKGKDVEDEINKVLDSLASFNQFEKAAKLKTIWLEYKKNKRDGN